MISARSFVAGLMCLKSVLQSASVQHADPPNLCTILQSVLNNLNVILLWVGGGGGLSQKVNSFTSLSFNLSY